MPLYKNGSFVQDHWTAIAEGEAISPAGHVIVPLSWWQAERQAFADSHVAMGVRIEPGTAMDEFVEDLPRFALIALVIPKFQDGRAYTTARLCFATLVSTKAANAGSRARRASTASEASARSCRAGGAK